MLLVVSLSGVGFGGWLFWSGLPTDGERVGLPALSTETLSREKLAQILEVFKQRELKYEELVKTPQQIADPGKSGEASSVQPKTKGVGAK